MAKSLKSKSAKGFAWNLAGNFLKQGSSFLISIVLARILTPAEFGLVGMALVFITISQVFIDIGFASALIQRQDNTSITYSSVFYLNVFLGLVLTGIFYFGAPLIGAFYGNPEITVLVQWLSLVFVFNSLNIVQMAILRKELNFKILTVRIFVSTVVGGGVAIIAAFLGAGVYSLIIQNLVTAVVGTVLLWSTTVWKPSLQFSMSELRKLTGFSTFVFLDRTFSTISQQLDTLMVGKIFSPSMLGFYSRATSLRNIVTSYSSSSLTAVFFPVLSSLQEDDEEYRRVYFKVISVVAFLSYGLTGVLCILGQDVIILLFGQKWQGSIPIFQVLILMACNTPLNSMMVNAFLGKGKSKANFWIGILRKTVRLIPLAIMYFYGMFAFTVSFVIFSYCITVVNILFLDRYIGLSSQKHFIKIFEGLLPMGVVLAGFFYFEPQNVLVRLVWAFGFLVVYVLFSRIVNTEGFQFIRENLPLVKKKLTSMREKAL